MASGLPLGTIIAASVPLEIWHHISQFLLDTHLCQLYTINRAFFHIAIAARYNSVSLSSTGQSLQDFISLEYSSVSGLSRFVDHVRGLEFKADRCGAIHEVHQQPPSKPLVVLRSSQEVRAFMGSLRYLTNLTITWNPCSSHMLHCDAYVDLLSLGWLTFGPTLRSLSLTTAVDSIPSLFATPFHLPRLEKLEIDIRKDELTTDDSVIYSTVIPFIHHHASNLQALGLHLFSTVNYSKLYANLGHFPSLHTLTLTGTYGYQNHERCTDALSNSLSLHSDTLVQFHWEYWLYRGFDVVDDLHELRTLEVYFPVLYSTRPVCPSEFCDLCQSLSDRTHPLTSLHIPNVILSREEITQLLAVPTISHLRRLELSLDLFTYPIFANLASAPPYP